MMKLLTLFMILHSTLASRMLNAATSTCSDGNSCYNGSICMPLELDEGYVTPQEGRTTRCDCTTTTTDGVAFFVGYGCEYSSNESCLYGESNKGGTSFCVNGGKCKQKWSPNPGEETFHVGCVCKDGWEGDHCEYKEGEAPYKEDKASSKEGEGEAPDNTIPIIALAVVSSVLVIGGIFLISKKLRNDKEQIAAPNSPVGYQGDEEII